MFENNNKKILNTIVKHNLLYNRKRNIISIIAIALTTFLLTAVFAIGVNGYKSYETITFRVYGTSADGYLTNTDNEQINAIRDMDFVKSIGKSAYCGYGKTDDYNLGFIYQDNECFVMTSYALWGIKGNYPSKYNEIMLSTSALKKLGISKPKIGCEINLSYSSDAANTGVLSEDMTQGLFVLSGWYSSENATDTGDTCYVSKAFYDKSKNANEYADIQYKKGNFEKYVDYIKKNISLSSSQSIKLYDTADYGEEKMATVGVVLIILIFIMTTGYLLIYNVFYISALRDIQHYGLLKALGATSKQLKIIVYKQALILALIGITIGVVFGLFISQFCLPALIKTISDASKIKYWKFYMLTPIGAILFSFITVFISTGKPAKIVSKISAIEAIRYMADKNNSMKIKRRKTKENQAAISVMAYRNVFRNKKRAFIVYLSLILGLITFLCVITIVKSIDSEKYVDSMLDADIEIENDYIRGDDGKYYMSDVLSESMVEDILKIQGVKNVYPKLGVEYWNEYTNEYSSYSKWLNNTFGITEDGVKNNFYGNIIGIDAEMMSNYLKMSGKTLEKFKSGKYAYINTAYTDYFTLPANINMTLDFNKEKVSFTYGGGMNIGTFICTGNGTAPNMIISADKLKQMVPKDKLSIASLYVYVDKSCEAEVIKAVNDYLLGIKGIDIETKEDVRQEVTFMKTVINFVGGGLSLVFVFIGIMNFVNIMTSSIQARRRELSIMESVGMTRKQLNAMLRKEGFYYSGISLVIVWTVGSLLSYEMVNLLKGTVPYAVYDYPLGIMVVLTIFVILVCMIVPSISLKGILKTDLTMRIRWE